MCVCFFFQAEDGIRDLVRSRGLGDVYKRQTLVFRGANAMMRITRDGLAVYPEGALPPEKTSYPCLLYTSDAADDLLCVDLGGRRIIKKKTHRTR